LVLCDIFDGLVWLLFGFVGTRNVGFCDGCWLDNKSFNDDEERSVGLRRSIWWDTSWELDDNNEIDGVWGSIEDVCGRWWIVCDVDGGVDEREFIPKYQIEFSRTVEIYG
jgi:hypothetical protein